MYEHSFVGALDRAHYFKGLPQLLEALQELREHDWHLTVVGDGDLRAVYGAQARDALIADRVTFVGHISSDDLPRVYAQADLLFCQAWIGRKRLDLWRLRRRRPAFRRSYRIFRCQNGDRAGRDGTSRVPG